MYKVVGGTVAPDSLSVSKVKLCSQGFLDELQAGQPQYSEHGLRKPRDTNVCDELRCFERYEGSMPSPVGGEVFPVLQNGLLTRLEVAIGAIDTVRHHSHKVLQGLQVVRVSAR